MREIMLPCLTPLLSLLMFDTIGWLQSPDILTSWKTVTTVKQQHAMCA